MRDRPEILAEGLDAVNKETVLTQSDLRLTLLTLEVLVDIRDVLQTYIKVAQDLQVSLLSKT